MKKTQDSRIWSMGLWVYESIGLLTHRLIDLLTYRPMDLLCILCLASCVYLALYGCGCGTIPGQELPTASKGYILYVFARRTEVMIDFCKSDGISRGTKLDVFRMHVPGMDEPVKIGEVTVGEVGKKMSKAKVTAITSSLQMERGDRVFAHPVVIISDASWIASRMPAEGWRSDLSLPEERDWDSCEVISDRQAGMTPEIRQLVADTDAKPIWHPSVTSQRGDVFFRKVFHIDAEPVAAKISVACAGKTNIYLNGRWIGEAKEWPKTSSFRVNTFPERGRNLIAVHAISDPRSNAPPVLFLALTVQTEFQ